MAEHTPTPWQVTEHDNGLVVRTTDLAGRPIASLWLNGESPQANAAFICKAVNNHEALVSALEEILYYKGGADIVLDDEYVMERAQAALNAVVGGATK